MNSLDDWLQLFGYDPSKMQGAKYAKAMVQQPRVTIKDQQELAPEFSVMSGLQCITEKVKQSPT